MQLYNRFLLFSFLIVLLVFFPVQLFSAQNYTFTVVIDPGHGGRDPGAVGAHSLEKNIVLAVGLKLGELIKTNHPYVRVVYTRRSDVFVPLYERAAIANRANADLFISIHCNAIGGARAATAQGAEVFVLGMHRSEDNLAAAKRENAVIFLEDNYSYRYAGFDPNDPISYIIFEFLANEYLERSIQFASLVQNQLVSSANRVNRGVRQAGFLVLREVAMPSVLIELGFISNREEERFMMSTAGQTALANSIYNGFREYLSAHLRRTHTPGSVATQPQTSQIQTEIQVQPQEHSPTLSSTQTILTTPTEPIHHIAPGVREFRIQFLSSSRRHDENAAIFQGLSPVSYYRDGTTYRYTYGSSTCREEISRLLPHVRQFFRDAFIIEMIDGVRVR